MKPLNPLDHPIIVMQPLRLLSSAWMEHVPFGLLMIDLLRPNALVELGTREGVSYCAFCQAVKLLCLDTRCCAVDTWDGDRPGGTYGPEVLADLRAHHDPLYGEFSRLVQSTCDEAVGQFADGSIDLLHIVGLRTYETARHDFETWSPKLSDRAVVLVHGTNLREGDSGVWRLWAELRDKHPHLEFLHGQGLGVLGVGKGLPPAMSQLLDLRPDEAQGLREFFSALGLQLSANAEKDASIQLLTEKVERESSELSAIYSSAGWGLVQQLRRLQARVAPAGGRRDRLVQGLMGLFNFASIVRRRLGASEDLDLIRASELYDGEWYLRQYPDVASSGTDPARHYLFTGFLEGRDPGPDFSNNWYLKTYPDVELARVNPLVHFLRCGIREGRLPAEGADRWLPSRRPLHQQHWGIMSRPHTLFVADLISERLREHGCQVSVMTSPPEDYPLDLYIVLTAQAFDRLPPVEKRISFQLEQSVSSRWFTERYLRILRASPFVLEYSLRNLEFLGRKKVSYPQVYYVPLGASPTLYGNVPKPIEKRFDLLFYGDYTTSRRRQRMLAELQKDFSVKMVTGVFGPEMREIIRQSRVVVNLHYYENALLEVPRILECLSLGVPVVSESAQDQDNYPEIAGAIRFFKQGSVAEMLKVAKEALDDASLPQNVVEATERSGARFRFMFDRFLIGIGVMPAEHISKMELPDAHFSRPVVLSLPETIERRKYIRGLAKKGYALFDGMRKSPGWVGCALSYALLAQQALREGLERITVMEDDVVFPKDIDEKLEIIDEYLEQYNGEWHIFSGMVASLHPEARIVRDEDFRGMRFVTLDRMTSMVFNVYGKKALGIIATWDAANLDAQSNTIDRYLERQGNLRIIVTIPFLVRHDEKLESTLWGFQNAQYNKMIADSQKGIIDLARQRKESL